MIYLFDDKKNRQLGYNWTTDRFNKYAAYIHPIYQYDEIKEIAKRVEIFTNGNTVLFHESFFDAESNRHEKGSLQIRKELEIYADKNTNFNLAFFSGSKHERSLDKNMASLPVSILYQNLEEYIIKYLHNHPDLKYLLYGKNPDIEQEFVERLNRANYLFESGGVLNLNTKTNILIARTKRYNLARIMDGAEYKIIDNSSDSYFNETILLWLNDRQYDKIFIPLCFGSSLSDFNGLRVAMSIRCTKSLNQCSAIYLYSFVEMNCLINNPYFNILKVQNVCLIEYNNKAFDEAVNSNPDSLKLENLSQEILKLKLEVPQNYEDNHSITNEWAISRWATAIDTRNESIKRIIENVTGLLYFKYLNTIYPASDIPTIEENKLRIKNPGQPKILYVDDEADKGWHEILFKILKDINKIEHFVYLGDELRKVSQAEIIKKVRTKIIEDNIDLVILDFRLHPDDFLGMNIQDITGFKLLKEIKNINLGIQVVIFSATNRILNLQPLEIAGADGFILKESPEIALNGDITVEVIIQFLNTIQERISYSFLKELWDCREIIRITFSKSPLSKKYFQHNLPAQMRGIKYQILMLSELEAIFSILQTKNSNRFYHAMLMIYKMIEYMNEIFFAPADIGDVVTFYDNVGIEYFDKSTKKWKRKNDMINIRGKKVHIKVEWLNSTSNKFLNLISKKMKLNDTNMYNPIIKLSEYRNSYIHSNIEKRGKLEDLTSSNIVDWIKIFTQIITRL